MTYRELFRPPGGPVEVEASTLAPGDLLVLAGHTIEVEEVVAYGDGKVLVYPRSGRPLRYRVAEPVQVMRAGTP